MIQNLTRWPLERLKPHPKQLFSDLDGQAFQDLVEDLKIRGLQKPVEVLPDETDSDGGLRLEVLIPVGRVPDEHVLGGDPDEVVWHGTGLGGGGQCERGDKCRRKCQRRTKAHTNRVGRFGRSLSAAPGRERK